MRKYPFIGYQPDPDFLAQTEDELGALNETLKAVFGWKTCSTGDGSITIMECGENICAIVNVLGKYLALHPGNAMLNKWIADSSKGAKKVYKETNTDVCILILISRISLTFIKIAT